LKAMILAAGFGKRLRPLTHLRPKPLVPVANRPVIEHAMEYLEVQGFRRVIVNAHHLQEQVTRFFREKRGFEARVDVVVEPEILGTGGGLMNVAEIWGEETLLVMNGDVLCDIDPRPALAFHRGTGALATLLVHDHPSFSQVKVDPDGWITDISAEKIPGRLAFTGIHIVEPGLRAWLPPEGFSDIVPVYRELIKEGGMVAAYRVSGHYWRDIGTLESYLAANREYTGNAPAVGPGCLIHPSVTFTGWSAVGRGCGLEPGVTLERSVLWEGVKVREGVRVRNSVVTSGRTVLDDLDGEVF